ncbi:hypothetical protein PG990_014643 [Apiospora arundinis]
MSTRTPSPAAQDVHLSPGSTSPPHQLQLVETPPSYHNVPESQDAGDQLPVTDMVKFDPVNVSAWSLTGQLVVQFFHDVPTYQFVTAQGWVIPVHPGADDQAQLEESLLAAQSS